MAFFWVLRLSNSIYEFCLFNLIYLNLLNRILLLFRAYRRIVTKAIVIFVLKLVWWLIRLEFNLLLEHHSVRGNPCDLPVLSCVHNLHIDMWDRFHRLLFARGLFTSLNLLSFLFIQRLCAKVTSWGKFCQIINLDGFQSWCLLDWKTLRKERSCWGIFLRNSPIVRTERPEVVTRHTFDKFDVNFFVHFDFELI